MDRPRNEGRLFRPHITVGHLIGYLALVWIGLDFFSGQTKGNFCLSVESRKIELLTYRPTERGYFCRKNHFLQKQLLSAERQKEHFLSESLSAEFLPKFSAKWPQEDSFV